MGSVTREIELVVNGRKVKGLLITKVYKKTRKKVVGGKTYYWEHWGVYVYVPQYLRGKKLAIVPLD